MPEPSLRRRCETHEKLANQTEQADVYIGNTIAAAITAVGVELAGVLSDKLDAIATHVDEFNHMDDHQRSQLAGAVNDGLERIVTQLDRIQKDLSWVKFQR